MASKADRGPVVQASEAWRLSPWKPLPRHPSSMASTDIVHVTIGTQKNRHSLKVPIKNTKQNEEGSKHDVLVSPLREKQRHLGRTNDLDHQEHARSTASVSHAGRRREQFPRRNHPRPMHGATWVLYTIPRNALIRAGTAHPWERPSWPMHVLLGPPEAGRGWQYYP